MEKKYLIVKFMCDSRRYSWRISGPRCRYLIMVLRTAQAVDKHEWKERMHQFCIRSYR
ncbi:hypothetical protein [uncultured Ruminococcus sp.]|uniref:hypothetical protein n=1 Tax=uncultured Ruminococcus sp. TaxID=165186 RepID=UPI0025F02562|nr:hypothetical protein [uncultured Ruminococcus sp.]